MSETNPIIPQDSVLSISITHDATITRGSGVLLSSGVYVLTVAHLFDNYIYGQSIDIVTANGEVLNDLEVFIHHGWDSTNTNYNHDIALIKLSSAASNPGLLIWQEENYEGVEFTLTGFGNNGALHTGANVFDGDASLFNNITNKQIVTNTQVFYDYDNGFEHQNISKNLFNIDSSATAITNETLAKQGDSGGALLVNEQIAGISSYVYRDAAYDVNHVIDSSFGELGIATLAKTYIPWINYIIDGNATSVAPEIVSDVITRVAEPFGGSVINYFLLTTTNVSSETTRFSYVTRDGTATSGLDYGHAEGWIELLANETQVASGVTIYGDTVPEVDETFSLVLTDMTNQWLGIDVELIATHTIVNNDIFSV